MSNLLFIGLGGFLGSIVRYLFSGYVEGILKSADFLYGTIAVNLTGCLIIGFRSQPAESHAESKIKRGMLATVEKVQVRIYRGGEPGN